MGVTGVKPLTEAVNEQEVPVVVKLVLPADLYAELKAQAGDSGKVGDTILHRLTACRDHTSARSLYFDQSDLAVLEALLQHRNVTSPDEVLDLIRTLLLVQVGDFPPIPISMQQAKRIRMSAYGGQTPEQRLAYIIKGAISKATGI